MSEHQSFLKEKADCGCGCSLHGTPKRPNRNGVQCVRGCVCASCRGRNNRRKGLKKQNVARKALGIPGSKFGDSNEERWQDTVFANECKEGKQVGPVAKHLERPE